MSDGQITITKLTQHEDGWTANVNGVPVETRGLSGTMSLWVTTPRRGNGRMLHEVQPRVRAALVRKVRQVERREAQEAEVQS